MMLKMFDLQGKGTLLFSGTWCNGCTSLEILFLNIFFLEEVNENKIKK